MLKIRLTRRGKKNSAFFRIVVAEHTAPIKGGFLEVLGFLNPHTKEKSFKADRIEYWIGKGAQCSDTVHNLLVSNEVIKGPKRAVKLKKKPVEEKKEEVSSENKPEETKAEKPKIEEAKSEEKAAEPKLEEKKEAEIKSETAKPEPEKKEEKVEQPKTEEPKEEKK